MKTKIRNNRSILQKRLNCLTLFMKCHPDLCYNVAKTEKHAIS